MKAFKPLNFFLPAANKGSTFSTAIRPKYFQQINSFSNSAKKPQLPSSQLPGSKKLTQTQKFNKDLQKEILSSKNNKYSSQSSKEHIFSNNHSSVFYALGTLGASLFTSWFLAKATVFAEEEKGAQFITAIANGDLEKLKELLSKKEYEEIKYGWEEITLLMVACEFGKIEIIKWLLESGKAKVDEKDRDGRTALHRAAEEGHQAILELLLKQGAKVDEKDRVGQTALHRAAAGGHQASLELLLKQGAKVDEKDEGGQTALHWAAAGGQQMSLLKYWAKLGKRDKYAATLHRAAAGGHQASLELLLKQGAKVDEKDRDGQTALHRAAAGGHQASLELLLKQGAKVDEKDKDGWTALHRAAAGGHQASLELLLKQGAKVDEKDRGDRTALHRAAAGGHQASLELLLKQGAKVDEKDRDGQTALHRAAAGGHQASLELLLKQGAKVDEKDEGGQTALHWAAAGGQQMSLLKYWAKLDERDKYAATLHRAAAGGHQASLELLLKQGAKVDEKDEDGQTALHRAAAGGHQASLELLLKQGAKVDEKDKDGWTALHWAAAGGHQANLELLLKYGAKLDEKDNTGETALYKAIMGDDMSAIEFLLKEGTNINITNAKGETIFVYLEQRKKEFEEVVKNSHLFLDDYGRNAAKGLKLVNAISNYIKKQIKLNKTQTELTNAQDELRKTQIETYNKQQADTESAIDAFRKMLNEKLNVTIYADKAIWDGTVRPNATTIDKVLEIGQLATTLSDDVQLRIGATLARILLQQNFEEYKRKKTTYVEKFKNVYISEVTYEASYMIAERYKDQLLKLTSEGMDNLAQYFHDKLIDGLRSNHNSQKYWHTFSCDAAYNNTNSWSYGVLRTACWLRGKDGKTTPIVREMYDFMVGEGGPSIPLELRGRNERETNRDKEACWDSRELVDKVGILVEDKALKKEQNNNKSNEELFYISKLADPKYGVCYGESTDTTQLEFHEPEQHIKYLFQQNLLNLFQEDNKLKLKVIAETKTYSTFKIKRLITSYILENKSLGLTEREVEQAVKFDYKNKTLEINLDQDKLYELNIKLNGINVAANAARKQIEVDAENLAAQQKPTYRPS